MSYSITFKGIPEEDMQPYDVYCADNGFIDLYKFEILESCLKYKTKFDSSIIQLYKSLKFSLNQLMWAVQQETKKQLYNDYISEDTDSVKGELTLYGSMFRGSDTEDIDSIMKYAMESLIKYGAFIETPDYWNNSELWDTKYSDICEVLDYVIDEISGNVIHEFKTTFYKYSDEYQYNNKNFEINE